MRSLGALNTGAFPRMHTQVFPAAERNKAAILEALRPRLPPSGLVLEAASGTGQHVAHFAENLSPGLIWQPTGKGPGHLVELVIYGCVCMNFVLATGWWLPP